MRVQFVKHPKHAVHFDGVLGRECSQRIVGSQQDAAEVAFGERKRKAVMHGKLRQLTDDCLRTQNPFAGQVYNFEAPAKKGLFLRGGELEQLLFKQRVRYKKFIRKAEKGTRSDTLRRSIR